MPSAADLPQAYSELQQRFQRTTNALGSAAHDLKTPLAILNGYVELLQSEKLGSLNTRQREVLTDGAGALCGRDQPGQRGRAALCVHEQLLSDRAAQPPGPGGPRAHRPRRGAQLPEGRRDPL